MDIVVEPRSRLGASEGDKLGVLGLEHVRAIKVNDNNLVANKPVVVELELVVAHSEICQGAERVSQHSLELLDGQACGGVLVQ